MARREAEAKNLIFRSRKSGLRDLGPFIRPPYPQYGCNPSGATAAVERKRETLELARKHDIIIFEGSSHI